MSVNVMDDPRIAMEQSLMEEYLSEQGYSMEQLKKLPSRVVKQLLKEANRYATLKMEEIKAKAYLVDEIVGGSAHHN